MALKLRRKFEVCTIGRLQQKNGAASFRRLLGSTAEPSVNQKRDGDRPERETRVFQTSVRAVLTPDQGTAGFTGCAPPRTSTFVTCSAPGAKTSCVITVRHPHAPPLG